MPGKSHRQRNLADYSPWSRKRVGHDWVTNTHTHLFQSHVSKKKKKKVTLWSSGGLGFQHMYFRDTQLSRLNSSKDTSCLEKHSAVPTLTAAFRRTFGTDHSCWCWSHRQSSGGPRTQLEQTGWGCCQWGSICVFLATPRGMQDLSSLPRDWTCALCSGSAESQTLDCWANSSKAASGGTLGSDPACYTWQVIQPLWGSSLKRIWP